MKRVYPVFIIAILITVFACTFSVCAKENQNIIFDQAYKNHPTHVFGEIVVDLKDHTSMSEIEKLEKQLSIDLKFNSKYSEEERVMTAEVGEYNMNAVLGKLKKDKRVEYAEPNYYYHIMASKPNDPLYKYQWHMEKIKVRDAWDHTKGEGVVVAVIDTGVAYKNYDRFHRVEDLENTKFVKGYNFVSKNEHPCDDHAHGTHVAGTIAQSTNNGKGVAGIAYKCKIMPLKVLAGNGYGRVSDIADAIRYAADNGAKVINMSLGGPFPSSVMKSACDYAYSKGVVIICAAGNSKSKNPGYPAGFKSCVSVSAIRFDDKLAPYTNRGKSIDIAAPGGDTTVDQNGDGKPDGVIQNTIKVRDPEHEGYYIFQGTSMAAPHAAGVAALVAASGVTDNKEIINILKKTARKKGLNLEEGYGAGIIDAGAAVKAAIIDRGWIKLVIAIVVLVIIIIIVGLAGSTKFQHSPMFYIGWLMGAAGLFFLGYFKAGNVPGMGLLMKSIPEWDTVLFGADSHINPLFYSVLIPFVIGVVLYKTKWQKLAAGFSIGVAAQILFVMFSRTDVRWIPGTFILDKAWLLVNFVLAAFLGYLLLTVKKDDKVETQP